MYIGCLLLPILVVLILCIAVISKVANFAGTFFLYYWNKIGFFLTDCWEFITKPFRPKPLESDFDSNYYTHTEEQPKRYSENDGDYVNFKKEKKF